MYIQPAMSRRNKDSGTFWHSDNECHAPVPETPPAWKWPTRPPKTPIFRVEVAHGTPNRAHWDRNYRAEKLRCWVVHLTRPLRPRKPNFFVFLARFGPWMSKYLRCAGPLQKAPRPCNGKKSLCFDFFVIFRTAIKIFALQCVSVHVYFCISNSK